MVSKTREIRLMRRPHGMPTDEDLQIFTSELPDLTAGQVLVENTFLTVDPYMRPRMNDVKSYVEPYKLGSPLEGGAVGTVIQSCDSGIPVGASVYHGLGWREHSVVESEALRILNDDSIPISYHLGLLGMPGLTAYAGLFDVASFRPGDSVFVSGAAGAVGSLVGQFAKLSGASRVVGSAGSAAKVEFLTEHLGFDAAFNYRDGNLGGQLATALPGGLDVYFDNVGGDHLSAAIENCNDFARIALCGAIAGYNDEVSPVIPGNMSLAVSRRISLRGFISSDHATLRPEFEEKVKKWLASGSLIYRETVVDGLDNMVDSFRGLLAGANIGKMVIRL